MSDRDQATMPVLDKIRALCAAMADEEYISWPEMTDLLHEAAETIERERLAHQETRGCIAAWKQKCREREDVLRAVAASPNVVCMGDHPSPCDCVGDMVRQVLKDSHD